VAARLLTLILVLTLPLTENEGFSPEFIYERARLRALSSKYEFDFKEFDFKEFDFKDFDFKDFDFYFFHLNKINKINKKGELS
jgi:hypothetical protein